MSFLTIISVIEIQMDIRKFLDFFRSVHLTKHRLMFYQCRFLIVYVIALIFSSVEIEVSNGSLLIF